MSKTIEVVNPNIGEIDGNQISIEGIAEDGSIIDLHIGLNAIKKIVIEVKDTAIVKEKPLSERLRGKAIKVSLNNK